MSKYSLLICFLSFSFAQLHAEENDLADQTTVQLEHISADTVVSVLESLVGDSLSISQKDKTLFISGSKEKAKSILPIIKEIDSPPTPLTIEFIASNRKINFNKTGTNYQSRSHTSQSMSIIERQWITLNTGLSIPIAQRQRAADGTETQSFRYKKVSKSYVFKVHEFSGWSVIQVGVDASELEGGPVGPIEHTQLNTTIVGKTGEWLEVASTNKVNPNNNSQTYSTNRPNPKYIHLYVKVKKNEATKEPAEKKK